MVNPATLARHYKSHSSGYADWPAKAHADRWLVFPENIGARLSIDEVSLSNGELWTMLTNKAGKGRRGTLVAAVRGTRIRDIVHVVRRIPTGRRDLVEEVSMDMAKNMEAAVGEVFSNTKMVTDRFHVMQLVGRSLQEVRLQLWRKELDRESQAMARAKAGGLPYRAEVLANGDTPKQLLARCRYALMRREGSIKDPNQWLRLRIAFDRHPELERAWRHTQELGAVYRNTDRSTAENQLDRWIDETHRYDHENFKSAAESIRWHRDTILNFFDNRSTNASAESFNARIKLFRANQKGVRDTKFFLFRLTKLYA